jgi:hypothetical protein
MVSAPWQADSTAQWLQDTDDRTAHRRAVRYPIEPWRPYAVRPSSKESSVNHRPHILVILGSTRQGRHGDKVVQCLMRGFNARSDATLTG